VKSSSRARHADDAVSGDMREREHLATTSGCRAELVHRRVEAQLRDRGHRRDPRTDRERRVLMNERPPLGV
jgi:hypothetical protein